MSVTVKTSETFPLVNIGEVSVNESKLAQQRENASSYDIDYSPGVSLEFAASLADDLWAASAAA